MTPCESCEREVATNSKSCVHCGHERTTTAGWWALASGFVCFVGATTAADEGVPLDLSGLGAVAVIVGSGWVCYQALMRWRLFI